MTHSNGAPPTALDVFVARQPIFDLQSRRVAYELLYRSSVEATTANGPGQERMCDHTALHSLVSIGLDRLTAGVTAYVNVAREHLVGELFRIFEPGNVVLELLESIEVDQEVIDACKHAVTDGYVLALDDYDGRPSLDALLPFARIVKLDVLDKTEAELAPVIERLRAMGKTVLAERVETTEQRVLCTRLGCELFQGYVFSRPETLDGRTLSVQDSAILRILAIVDDPNVNDMAIEEAFRSHPSLSHALLRIVASASIGVSNVTSIAHAIRIVGRSALSRWMLVMLVGSMSSRNAVMNETVLQTLVRARFCELLTVHAGGGNPSERFLVGLLSRMDMLLGQSMTEVLKRLPVDDAVRAALVYRTGPHAATLRLIEDYESAHWDRVAEHARAIGTGGASLVDLYGLSAQWAAERVTPAMPRRGAAAA